MINKQALLRQIRNAYENTSDNIIGVGFGLKEVNGARTNRKGIVFFVREKKPLAHLRADEILPSTISIAGVDYPCDVIQTEPFKALTTCYNNNDQSVYEIARLQGQTNDGLLAPMRGGQEIFIFPGGWDPYGGASLGTLGFFAIDNTDDRVVGVTNTHVVIENLLYAADPVRLPALTLPAEVIQYNPYNTIEPKPWAPTGDYYPAGFLVRNGIDYHHAGLNIKRYTPYSTQEYNYVDAALVIMNDGQFLGNGDYFVDANSYKIWQPSSLTNPHTAHYPFATTEEIDDLVGARVYSTGRTTGPKGYCDTIPESILQITGVHVTSTIGFSADVSVEFADLIQYKSSNGFETIYRASLPGDSGSALLADIVNPDTGVVTRKIIGIVFAGNGIIGLANRIDRLASMLDIRAWDESYQFTRSSSLSLPTPRIITEPVETAGEELHVTRDGEKYWHAGLTFQQYYIQWAPTDITLTNNSVIETAYGGQIIGYFDTVDSDVWDNFTYTLVEGEGDGDNASFRIIADQLQVALPANNEEDAESDIFWRRVVFLLSAQYDCIIGSGSLADESLLGKLVVPTGIAQLVNPIVIASNNSYPSPKPDSEKWPDTDRCGFGFVDVGPGNYIAVNDNITLNDDFTIECWLWPTSYDNAQTAAFIEGQNSSEDASRLCVYLNYGSSRGVFVTKGPGASELGPFVTTGAINNQSRSRLPTNTWTHLAIVREEDTLRVYVNGVIYETGALTGIVKLQNPLLFAKRFVGYFADFRITTVARYTGPSFNLPTVSFAQAGPTTFDYETKNQYSIRVRSTDAGGNYFEKTFIINVLNAIEYPPTDILAKKINDDPPPTTIYTDIGLTEPIWKFVTIDQDLNDSFVYDLVPGVGSTNNDLFRIGDVDRLYRNGTLVAGTTYSIRVRTTDLADMSFEKIFTIAAAEPPARPFFDLQKETAFENSQTNLTDTLAGTFVITSKDPNSAHDEITFALHGSTNDFPHNALFTIDNTYNDGVANVAQARLRAAVDITPATFPSSPFFTINVRGTDTRTGRYTDQSFSIGREFPTAPYMESLENPYVICWSGQTAYAQDEFITNLSIVFDGESTFNDITAEFVTTCAGQTLSNNLFSLFKNTTTNKYELRIANAINFNSGGYSNTTLYLCIKLTDTRTNLTNTGLAYVFTGMCDSVGPPGS